MVGSIVVMSRVEHAHDMIPKVKQAIEEMNEDGSLPRGVKLVPYSTPSMTSPTPGSRNSAASAPSSTSTARSCKTTSTAWT